MAATRNRIVVTARTQDGGYVRVERRSFGSEANLQRQCSTGELLFDTTTKKFVHVGSDKKREVFDPKTASTSGLIISLKEQKAN